MSDTSSSSPRIRRGDTVRLPGGATATVTSTAGGYIFAAGRTWGPWQVVKVAKG